MMLVRVGGARHGAEDVVPIDAWEIFAPFHWHVELVTCHTVASLSEVVIEATHLAKTCKVGLFVHVEVKHPWRLCQHSAIRSQEPCKQIALQTRAATIKKKVQVLLAHHGSVLHSINGYTQTHFEMLSIVAKRGQPG